MKIAITGHTKGLGKFLYNSLSKSHDVSGLSRSTGFDLDKNYTEIIGILKNVDCFINNTYYKDYQIKLFEEATNHNKFIISMGSQARQFPNLVSSEYAKNKQDLYNVIKNASFCPSSQHLLHLDIGFLENDHYNANKVLSTYYTTYKEIYDFICYWLLNPKIVNVEFEAKIDIWTLQQITELNKE